MNTESLRVIIFMVTVAMFTNVFQPVSASGDDCLENSDTAGSVIGGLLGGAAGVGTAVATGAATITAVTAVAAGTGAGTMVAVGVVADCALTGCLITIATGIVSFVVGAWFGSEISKQFHDVNCAGAIVRNDKTNRFFWSFNADSTREGLNAAYQRCRKVSAGDAKDCKLVLPFRNCASIAKDVGGTLWAAARDKAASQANREALKLCEDTVDGKCRLVMKSVCNSS